MLRVDGISKRFRPRGGTVDALRDVTLSVDTGSFAAILGASGSGKTTLLRVIAGFEMPDEGSVVLNDRILTGPGVFEPPERRNVGVVAQDGALFPHLDVASNIAYGLGGKGELTSWWPRRRGTHVARVEELLELVGLDGYGSRMPRELSGGQQQRVALARALAPNPGLLLMDEPFSALDAGLRTNLREEVRDLLRGLNTTVVLVTHDQNEALSMADHVAIMSDGAVVQSGRPGELYRNPVDRATAEFLGSAMVLPADLITSGSADEDSLARCDLGVVPVAARISGSGNDPGTPGRPDRAKDTFAVIRPEQLVLDDSGAPGNVRSVNFYGHDATAHVVLDGSGTEIVVRLPGEHLPQRGERVGVALAPGVKARLI